MPPDAQPHGEPILNGRGKTPWPVSGGPMASRPVRVRLVAQQEHELELLLEQGVVVREVQPEEGERLGERAAAEDQLGATTGDEVEGGEALEDADGIGGTEHRHRAAQPDAAGQRRRGGQDHHGRGVEVVRPVVLADAERVDPRPVGGHDLGQELAHPLGRGVGAAGPRIGHLRDEAVDADLHGTLSLLRKHADDARRSNSYHLLQDTDRHRTGDRRGPGHRQGRRRARRRLSQDRLQRDERAPSRSPPPPGNGSSGRWPSWTTSPTSPPVGCVTAVPG